MGMTEELKIWYTCKREGRIKEYQDYKAQIKLKKLDTERFKGYIVNAENALEEAKGKFSEDSREYRNLKDQVGRWRQCLDDSEAALKFIRPNRPEDIEYREGLIAKEYVNKLQEVISPNLDLRFHGTPIYFAEQIIKSGGICSAADRYDGYVKSTDMKGEISASTVKTLSRTIDFFSDMAGYGRCLPAGCIFAMLPKDKEDANYGIDLLHSVDFRKNPEQLFRSIYHSRKYRTSYDMDERSRISR